MRVTIVFLLQRKMFSIKETKRDETNSTYHVGRHIYSNCLQDTAGCMGIGCNGNTYLDRRNGNRQKCVNMEDCMYYSLYHNRMDSNDSKNS